MKPEYFGLALSFKVNPNSCDNPNHSEDYIRFVAIADKVKGAGTTHVLLEIDDATANPTAILGYVTLKATSITMTDGDKVYGHPAMEITELAVAHNSERRGYGTLLVQYALTLALELNLKYLGIRYIALCADPKAVGFYARLQFSPMAAHYDLPREGWNVDCTPMMLGIDIT